MIVVTWGEPMGQVGGTNALKIVVARHEDERRLESSVEASLVEPNFLIPIWRYLPWPLVSMRQLLDHAAENGYGLPAFNVNNLEQVSAIMAAADEVGAPVIMQASAGARKYAGEAFLRHLIDGRGRSLSAHPGRDAPGPRPVAGGLHGRDQVRLHLGDDGRLADGRRQVGRQL